MTLVTEKHTLYKQLVAWNCNGCLIAPLTQYTNNPIYQEWPREGEYYTKPDGRVYIWPNRQQMEHFRVGKIKTQRWGDSFKSKSESSSC